MSNEQNEQYRVDASPFDAIRHESDQYGEYWSGKELYKLLGYSSWQRFQHAIEQGKKACEASGHAVSDHFNADVKMIRTGKGAQRKTDDVRLSRYGCYLTIQNADPNGKPLVGLAQTYFAVQTRRQELSDKSSVRNKSVLSGNNNHLYSMSYQMHRKTVRGEFGKLKSLDPKLLHFR